MDQDEKFTLEEAHREFAKRSNGQVWKLLEKPDRSADEDSEMVSAAFASLYHWAHVGTQVHRQRAEWLLARIHTVRGESDLAISHANRCLAITESHQDQMQDFDLAYAHEAIARSFALAGQREEATKHLEVARAAGEAIADPESKQIFMADLEGGDWHGLK